VQAPKWRRHVQILARASTFQGEFRPFRAIPNVRSLGFRESGAPVNGGACQPGKRLAQAKRRRHSLRRSGARPGRRGGETQTQSGTAMDDKGLTPEERAALVEQIERLREEHRDLDAAIEALRDAGQADQLQVQRLKKRKLLLRDKLARLEDQLTPDIIA